MKTSLIFGIIALFAFVSFTQITFAIETEQEPGPPQIPEPSPIPEPIRMPDPAPDPAPDPFPHESDSDKVKRLTKENDNLKQQNKNLQNQIFSLNNEKSRLQAEILELNNSIQSLKEITLEQVRVIMDLANQLKEIIYEKIFSPIIQL